MVTRWVALVLAAAIFTFVAVFIWAALRLGSLAETPTGDTPTAVISEILSDGRIDAQVFALGGRDIQLEIQFAADADALEIAGQQPTVSFTMAGMASDGLDPPLEPVDVGIWRARFRLPMAGRWIVSVGFGEEFAEVEFDAR